VNIRTANHSRHPLASDETGASAGMALKKGISLVNTQGTIDADYRGAGGFRHTGTK
jgi:dUTPase